MNLNYRLLDTTFMIYSAIIYTINFYIILSITNRNLKYVECFKSGDGVLDDSLPALHVETVQLSPAAVQQDGAGTSHNSLRYSL